MDWSYFLAAAVTSLLTFLGVVIAKKIDFKSKKLDIAQSQDEAVAKCQEKHKGDIDKVKSEFNQRLDVLSGKLDDIKSEQLRTALYITQLQSDMHSLKASIPEMLSKINHLEQVDAVMSTRLDNIEKSHE